MKQIAKSLSVSRHTHIRRYKTLARTLSYGSKWRSIRNFEEDWYQQKCISWGIPQIKQFRQYIRHLKECNGIMSSDRIPKKVLKISTSSHNRSQQTQCWRRVWWWWWWLLLLLLWPRWWHSDFSKSVNLLSQHCQEWWHVLLGLAAEHHPTPIHYI
jgi:hypothetical protein